MSNLPCQFLSVDAQNNIPPWCTSEYRPKNNYRVGSEIVDATRIKYSKTFISKRI